MTTTGWPQTLFLIGILASFLIAIAYVRARASVRKQNRKLGWFTTAATVFGIAVILYTSLHGNLFQFLFTHTRSGSFGIFSTGTPNASAPVAHATTIIPMPHTMNHATVLVPQHIAVQKVGVSRQHVSSALSSPAHTSHLASFLITLEGIASIFGIMLAISMLFAGLSLVVRHLRRRQEDTFLDAPSAGCAICGQEGEFPSYRDTKGQLAHLCTDCVPRFQVTLVA